MKNNNSTNFHKSEDGHIHVKNISAYWLPAFKLQREIGGTIHTVSGSYEGTTTLDKKLHHIMTQDVGGIHDK